MSATRPTLRGFGGAVAAGHYLAAQIGGQVLAEGGNAADAACAMGFALVVLEPTQNGLGGEVPILVWCAREERAWCVAGQGGAPATASIRAFSGVPHDLIPHDGFMPAAIPGALDAWCRLLERFGSWPFERVVAPARGLAERGYPMYPFLQVMLRFVAQRFEKEWPSSAAIYLPIRDIGERQTNPALGSFLGDLCQAARAAGGREAGIRAARDRFYRGPGAEAIERFLARPILDATGESNKGFLRAEDMAGYEGAIETPAEYDYRGNRVFKAPPWSQGPVFLQQLALLEGFDLGAMERRGPDALHTWIEASKLAFADREASYGDPSHVEVPLSRLLSREYNDERRKLIDPGRASLELRPGLGRLPAGWPLVAADDALGTPMEPQAIATAKGRNDTTQLVAADRDGNLVAATPSGGWIPSSPVVPELGFPMGTRLQMAVLDAQHPNALLPGKRPRTTLSPSLARLADGRVMAFGTPGGDQQDQWPAHVFHDLVDFGEADLQTAIDRPSLHSEHMPSSFYPRRARPGVVCVEDRMPAETLAALEARGHRLVRSGGWEHGRVMAVTRRSSDGRCEAAASPRGAIAYAIALP
jgi:gamma-glutamyltranspeptidase/glutathione hydrolase